MKVCVVGNSHVGSLREAAAVDKDRLPFEIDFYAMLAAHPVFKEGRLVCPDPSKIFTNIPGAAENGLRLGDYDYILLSAGGYWVFRNEQAGHMMFEIRLSNWTANPAVDFALPRAVSADVFRATVKCMQNISTTIQTCRILAKRFDGRICVQPWPLPSSSMLKDRNWRLKQLYGPNIAPISAYFFQTQYSVVSELTKEMRPDIKMLTYPRDEWFAYGFTPEEYEAPDPWHMNARYGSIVLAQFRECCEKWDIEDKSVFQGYMSR
jgi:hypothetical protein